MSGAQVLAALTAAERSFLDGIGFDAPMFEQLVDDYVAGALPPNRVDGEVTAGQIQATADY